MVKIIIWDVIIVFKCKVVCSGNIKEKRGFCEIINVNFVF